MSNINTNENGGTPKIYKAICGVIGDVGAVSKDKQNVQQNYKYRSIDDVYNALNPALAKHGVVIMPDVIDVDKAERTNKNGTVMTYTTVKVEYTFYAAEDGSSIQTTFYGEASDTGDKSINKAMSAAMKYACFQVFCIPTEDLQDDADKTSPEQSAPKKTSANYGKESHKRYQDYLTNGGINPNEFITGEERETLFAKTDTEIVRQVIESFGYTNTKTILKKDFDAILKKIVDETISGDETGEATMNEHLQQGGDLPYDDTLPFNTNNDIPA